MARNDTAEEEGEEVDEVMTDTRKEGKRDGKAWERVKVVVACERNHSMHKQHSCLS
jgi:hypothetical protein